MSSLTPQSGGCKGDTSFDSVFVSPGTRRQPLSASGTTLLENCPGNNDERERRQLRRSRVFDLQFSTESPLSAHSPVSKHGGTSSPAIPQLSNAQIADHYSVCIKLSTENKITTKNAFGLHLIDYLTEILKQKDSELTNFKVAAGSLDASAKIYAVRVDAVHADVYRVLGGLAKDSGPTEPVGGPEAGGGDADSEVSRKQQAKRKHQQKTIEQNLNNINVSEAEGRCQVDPMFQRTVSSFDECSTAGVFLTSLHTHNHLSEVLFDSMITALPSSLTSESPKSSRVEVADLKSILLRCVEKRPICPSLAGFTFTQWDNEAHNESVSALLEKFKKSDQAFDINVEADCDSEEDAEAPAENDFDADAPDQTAGMDLGEFSGKLEPCRIGSGTPRKDVALLGKDVESMCTHLSLNPSEYSYFSPRIMSAWAGPEYWRFKPCHKGGSNSERTSKRKTMKKVFEINFDDEIEFEVHFCKTRAATTLAKSTLESQNKKRNTLPEDFHYDVNNLTCLFLKPANRLCEAPLQGKSPRHEDEIGEYDYNNPNDTSNFCPALQDADSDDEETPGDFLGQGGVFEMTANPARGASQEAESNGGPNGRFNITTYSESILVAEPQKVNKIDIHYAKTAKKMDMKRLKRTMWCLLTDAQSSQMEAEESNAMEDEAKSPEVPGQKVFSSITRDLLHRLPSVMAKNLSVPLAFACLLHLANEKNLKLEGVEDLSEVLVLQDE